MLSPLSLLPSRCATGRAASRTCSLAQPLWRTTTLGMLPSTSHPFRCGCCAISAGAIRWGWGMGDGLSQPPSPIPHPLPRYGPPVVESFAATPAHQPWIIHLAEGTDAISAAELSWLDHLGCLADNTVLVHGAGLTAADIERVIARDAAVIWCPSSNLSMLGRTLDPRRLFDPGRLAPGSDSRLSGARHLREELQGATA